MATSIEKIQQLMTELTGPPDAEDGPLELMLRTMVMTGGPMLGQIIPEDPQMLDEYLEWLAVKVLSIRSDDAEPLRLAQSTPELGAGE